MRADDFGDPYITDGQARSIHKGMLAAVAWRKLGGVSHSGMYTERRASGSCYEYPVRGSGDANDIVSGHATWWQFRIIDSRISGIHHGPSDALPDRPS